MLEELNPELKEADALLTAQEYEERLARRNRLPDFAAGIGWETMANGKQEAPNAYAFYSKAVNVDSLARLSLENRKSP